MSQFPEIREADAPPEIAALYADIRESAVLPQVNLIFRHFAARPGVLPWVWAGLRPLYRSQELADAARRLSLGLERPGPSPLAGLLQAGEQAAVKTVLDAYNSGNPQNLIGLTALLRVLDNRNGRRSIRALALHPRTDIAGGAGPAFPALPRRDQLGPDILAAIERLASRHDTAAGAVPSLYLHLALWPHVLGPTDTYLAPIMARDDWQARIDTVMTAADDTASRLVEGIELLREPPQEPVIQPVIEEVAATLRTFVGAMIPELVVIGRLLAIE